MEKQRFEQLTKDLPGTSEPVIIPLNVKPKNGRTAPKSKEHKAKISAALKGRKMSDVTKAKMSEARKGRAPWNKGKKKYKKPQSIVERILDYIKGLFTKRSK